MPHPIKRNESFYSKCFRMRGERLLDRELTTCMQFTSNCLRFRLPACVFKWFCLDSSFSTRWQQPESSAVILQLAAVNPRWLPFDPALYPLPAIMLHILDAVFCILVCATSDAASLATVIHNIVGCPGLLAF